MQLVPKRQIGGNLYKIDNTMPPNNSKIYSSTK